MAGAFS
ncbi:hypothetical protein YPPY48_3490, partial [Yersinia pestis PY-48]